MIKSRHILISVALVIALLLSGSRRAAEAGNPVSDGLNLLVAFSQPANLNPGTPVYLRGEQVGTVSGLEATGEPTSFILSIDKDAWKKLPEGTVALLSAQLSNAASNKSDGQTVVDLIPPLSQVSENLEPGDSLDGFSSFEEFWRN